MVVLESGHVGFTGVVPLPGLGVGSGVGVVSPLSAQLAQRGYEEDCVSATVKPNNPKPVSWKTGTAAEADEGSLGVVLDVAQPPTTTCWVRSKVRSSTEESTHPLHKKVYEKCVELTNVPLAIGASERAELSIAVGAV